MHNKLKSVLIIYLLIQWGLICDKEWVFDFITSIQMLGMLFGSVFGSQFADW